MTTIGARREAVILFLGDVIIFLFSVWVALFLRHFELPDSYTYLAHLLPFSILALIWTSVYFIAGLYEKHTLILKSKLPNTLFNSQVINAFISVIFFYFFPQFGINPKTNLFIYICVSSVLVFIWRIYGGRVFAPSVREKAIIIGSGEEVNQLREEINNNPRYNFSFVSAFNLDHASEVDFKEEIMNRIYADEVKVIVVDFDNQALSPILPHLYNLVFSKVRFIDMHKVYEDVFDRVPLSILKHSWFLENISVKPKVTYDFVKRFMDIALSLVLAIASLPFYLLVYVLIKLDDGGDIFIVQERVGQNKKNMKIYKFRTMSSKEGVDVLKDEAKRVTKVGAFLRKSRIDELPQLWNVINGDLSLIGPRPELPALAKEYEEEINYYDVRHLIKPGLSGWAQLYHENHPHHGINKEETKEKLSYDLYYIKNRSVMLDLKIALKTIKALLSRTGA